jgi:hypothetical protein
VTARVPIPPLKAWRFLRELDEPPDWVPIAELFVVILVVGLMTGVALKAWFVGQAHLDQIEVLSLSLGARVRMAEYYAVYGRWPDVEREIALPPLSLSGGKYVAAIRVRPGGALDFQFGSQNPGLAGETLTLRAWQNPAGADLPIAWVCGRVQRPPLEAQAADATTLTMEQLASPCRSH